MPLISDQMNPNLYASGRKAGDVSVFFRFFSFFFMNNKNPKDSLYFESVFPLNVTAILKLCNSVKTHIKGKIALKLGVGA
jgi:hypothetical protein